MGSDNSILIIGKPSSSKTTFLAQFVTIARKNKSTITFWKTPENIQPIQDAMGYLRNGNETQSTHAESSLIISLPVSINGRNIELKCPDYGGEQINHILEQHEIDDSWSELIRVSKSWILFIRPQSIPLTYDLSNKSISEASEGPSAKPIVDFSISEQSSFIELLQMMLAVKRVSWQKEIADPKLTLALTCWDELTGAGTPGAYLAAHLPLLNQFLRTNWHGDALNIIGVSAQGLDLKSPENKDKYLDEGPEKFPFVVTENSTEKVYDLTLLIAEAL